MARTDKGLPTGTVTFLMTDIEGSTQLWERNPDAMKQALARHDEIVADAVQGHTGTLVKTKGEGDSAFAVFARASDGAAGVLELQLLLVKESWPADIALRVRAALHSGEAELRDGDYFGSVVNRCARLRAVAHGGQTIMSQSTAELVADHLPGEASLKDLGSHLLKDLARPDHVFELSHPDLPSDFPPLRSLEALPNNLPVQLTSFVGREREMATVKELLRENRMLTLTGAAGCGKTRLTLQVAAEILENYADGVWFVDLGPLTDPSLVLQALATVLGVREGHSAQSFTLTVSPEPLRALPELVVEQLRHRQVLLILDNCEHLLEASAKVSELLLRSCPGVRLLLTSREPVGLPAETTWRVPSLSAPDPERPLPLETLGAFEAVRLFLDRARQRRPDFALSPQVAQSVTQICHRLDGIPLAIELAAARVKVLTPQQIAARLDDRFTLLTGGSRTALERHQTLRAAVDWSYEALSEPEQVLLARISIFAGGFTLEAAEEVCAGEGVARDMVLDYLAQLVDKSLLVMESRGESARYRMLETIRQYGRERLFASGAAEVFRTRHRDFFLTLAESSTRRLWDAHQIVVMDQLDDELDNLRQAFDWSLSRKDAEACLRLAGALDRFWSSRRPREGGRWLGDALRGASTEPTFLRARALAAAGLLAWQTGDYSPARSMLEESLAIYRQLGIRRGIIWSLLNLAMICEVQRLADESLSLVEEAMAVARETAHPQTIGWTLWARTMIAANRGDYEETQTFAEEALRILRGVGDDIGIKVGISFLALAAQGRGDFAASESLLGEIDLKGAGQAEDTAIHLLGNAALARGDHEAARHFFMKSLSPEREAVARPDKIYSIAGLGEIAIAEGQLDEAEGRFAEALAVDRGATSAGALTDCFNGLARVAAATGRLERAARLFGAADAWGLPTPLQFLAQADRDRRRAEARESLGETAFDAAYEAGRAMSIDHAVAYALEEKR